MENIEVKVVKGGPYLIKGDVSLHMASGEVKTVSGQTFLCRCGKSKNKPFCDGSHTGVEFDK